MSAYSNDQHISFEATQPLLAASIAPFFAAFVPLFTTGLRNTEGTAKTWVIIGYCLLMAGLAVLSFWVALKKNTILVHASSIQIKKHTYPISELKKLELRKKSRYIYIYNKQRWGAQTYHIKDVGEFEKISEALQAWAAHTQLELNVLEDK